MKEVTSQPEYDAALAAGEDDIRIVDGDVGVSGSATVRAYHSATVTAYDSATVTAYDSATVTAYDSATVTAYDSATVTAHDSATVTAHGSATVWAYNSATVRAYHSATVTAYGSGTVTACGSATVTAYGSATVTAYDSATVMAHGSATVRAHGSATVWAYNSATVRAHGSATVRAYDSATVRASGYVFIRISSPQVAIDAVRTCIVAIHRPGTSINGGQQIVCAAPTTPADWCEYYGVAVKDGIAILYKAVDDDYVSSQAFAYRPGTCPIAFDWDDGLIECGKGLHFSPTPWLALRFNPKAKRFVACPVALSDMRNPQEDDKYPDKIKARGCCGPVYKVDEDGNPL